MENVVQANLLAATASQEGAWNRAYNVACGSRTTLNVLATLIRNEVGENKPEALKIEPRYEEFRKGDIRHSLADISQVKELLGYFPVFSLQDGLKKASTWYLRSTV
ncbi:UDP-N-acetylglucosamine 4-epimerase [bioreactor metagenome]|uniref:UDP-N-acetylglucosamine 4-epimerase n=1 Tax=bioreactor metagenome TaxID=1076179 RepID=A0A645GAH8_9ZZZZ